MDCSILSVSLAAELVRGAKDPGSVLDFVESTHGRSEEAREAHQCCEGAPELISRDRLEASRGRGRIPTHFIWFGLVVVDKEEREMGSSVLHERVLQSRSHSNTIKSKHTCTCARSLLRSKKKTRERERKKKKETMIIVRTFLKHQISVSILILEYVIVPLQEI